MADNVAEKMNDLGISDAKKVAAEGVKPKGKKNKKMADDDGAAQHPLEIEPTPEFIAQREVLWAKLKKEHNDWVAAQDPTPITVTLPDGKVVEGNAWRTTPYEVAKTIRFSDDRSLRKSKVSPISALFFRCPTQGT
ncbi:hypothetical protein LSAT2_020309 [Lamellibrachia satsuma]|nr:hypothetical protein LSAT2_020309 [Lamellibrachia satsuma]